jgi:cellulose synthase/poly-beta-1,6-N-acetylglucosamine synthase-like glycosyltransferase
MIALSLAIGLVGLVLLLPTLSDLISLGRQRDSTLPPASDLRARFLVLIPAHNEELLLHQTIRSVQRLDWPAQGVEAIVIADNCTDRTADVARREGIRVLERQDADHPGKPHAIAWALSQLEIAEYDLVVVLDADSAIDPGYCRAIASLGDLRARAFQGWIGVSNPDENALTRMGAVFAAARCLYMNTLKTRAGLTVPFGNGLCLGTDVLRTHGWTAFSICEDWELYAILTAAGVPIIGVPEARVPSQEAISLAQGASQRSRWAAGKITVLLRYAPALMASRRIGWHQKLDAMAELTAPGPVVHAAGATGLAAGAWLLALPGWPLLAVLLLGSVGRLAVLTLLAVRHNPAPGRALLAFLLLPLYAVWRVGVQVRAMWLVGAGKPWVRTARHEERPEIRVTREP